MKYSVAKTKRFDRRQFTGHAGLLYRSLVSGLDSVLKGAKPSKKTSKRHEKAVRAVRKFLKQATSEDAVSEPKEAKKSKKSKSKSKSKTKADKKVGSKAKGSKKSKTAAREIKKLKKSKPLDPLLLTSEDNNVVQLRSPEKLLGSFETEKASDIMSLTPQSDEIVLPNSLEEPDGEKDDLKMIAGVGPKLEELLNGLGIFHFRQIAEWGRKDVDWVDNYLQFTGRIDRDNWIEQAIALAKGGRDEYVKVFGKEPR